MSKTDRILAIVSSIILVINYIELQIGTYLLKESQTLLDLENGLFRIIFIISLGTAFFYFARYFKSISESRIEKLIYLVILLTVISQSMKFFESAVQTFATLISTIMYLLIFIIILLAGIRILKLNESNDKYIKLSKLFVRSLFGVLILNLLVIPILLVSQKMEYFNILLVFYTVPYSILTLMFIRMEKKNQPLTNAIANAGLRER